jgi:hypothetical protein
MARGGVMQFRLNLLVFWVLVGTACLAVGLWLPAVSAGLGVAVLAPRVLDDRAVWSTMMAADRVLADAGRQRALFERLVTARNAERALSD